MIKCEYGYELNRRQNCRHDWFLNKNRYLLGKIVSNGENAKKLSKLLLQFTLTYNSTVTYYFKSPTFYLVSWVLQTTNTIGNPDGEQIFAWSANIRIKSILLGDSARNCRKSAAVALHTLRHPRKPALKWLPVIAAHAEW